MVRLGSSASDMKRLSPAAINRGIDALVRFRQVAAIHEATVRAVATSAVPGRQPGAVHRAGPGRGHRRRGDLGVRGGAPDPPRRAPGRAGLRPEGPGVRHRRRLDRADRGHPGRHPHGPQPEDRRHPPDPPLLLEAQAEHRRGRAVPATSVRPSRRRCARSSARGSTWPSGSSGTIGAVFQMVAAHRPPAATAARRARSTTSPSAATTSTAWCGGWPRPPRSRSGPASRGSTPGTDIILAGHSSSSRSCTPSGPTR